MSPTHAIHGSTDRICVRHTKRLKAGQSCPLCPSPSARAMPVGGSKAASKYRATPTHVDGIRFASKTEAALYEWAKSIGYTIVPHVRFPLYCLTSPGVAATWFTPDLLIMDGDDVTEVWEAKGAKACESRDYQLRARAFRLSYPSIPLRVFRRVGGQFVEDASVGSRYDGQAAPLSATRPTTSETDV